MQHKGKDIQPSREMPRSKIDIEKVSALAKLPLGEHEKLKYQQQIEKIVEFVEQLDEIKTQTVNPTYQVTGKKNAYRADQISIQTLTTEQVVGNSARHEDSYIVTDKVLDLDVAEDE